MSAGSTPEASDDARIPAGHAWGKLPVIFGSLAVVGFGISLALARGNEKQFYFSWLVAFMYFLSIALGGLYFVLLQFLSKAGWSAAVRRIAENAMVTLPFLAIFAIPILLGMHDLFHWARPDELARDAVLRSKAPFLNPTFFLVRMVIYFVVWTLLSAILIRSSFAQDESGDHAITRRLQMVAPPGMALFALTLTFAAIDWLMSLDAHWYSTIFGLYYFAGSVVAIYAFMIVIATGLRNAGIAEGAWRLDHFHDLGKLLFGFVVFWTYMGFAQFFLIWYANIPEETIWFRARLTGSWQNVTILLALCHFVIPFFVMMGRTIKRKPALLRIAALWMLAIHYVDLHWLVMPNLHAAGDAPALLDLTTFLAVGGAFLAIFGYFLKGHAVVPIRDPRLPESLSYENG